MKNQPKESRMDLAAKLGVINEAYEDERVWPVSPKTFQVDGSTKSIRRASCGAETKANNPIFVIGVSGCEGNSPARVQSPLSQIGEDVEGNKKRDTWSNPLEFLMSCISMSVGLGNVWRFPHTAYTNGGGAFLIPYLVVLIFIGKPLYFMEMALGQFSSYGPVKLWRVVPILKGVGYGQALSIWFVSTYYCVLIAITIFYFFASFQSVLPWTVCHPEWSSASNCYNSSSNLSQSEGSDLQSSSSLYFAKEVMKQWDNIDDGIGSPDWRLSLCLLLAWICVCLVLIRGVASSGKVAYFTAIFPYVVLITLLIRGVTLPGAFEGILYFVRPDWYKLLDLKTWYAAVVQCFFSLAVGSGPIIMFSSYNPFQHNIYRDGVIISLMDTFTSFLAGVTIFSILGNLAYESGKSVSDVAGGGPGLAFVSYPDAIAKFDMVPQLFAVLFFSMLFTLGIGSAVSLVGGIVTIICDAFPTWKRWLVTCVVCSIGFGAGLVYVTPGGLFVLDIVDYFGGGFIIFVMATVETIGICWIYGLNRFVRDVEFMLGIKLSSYWKLTWAYIIPATLVTIFVYSVVTYEPLKNGDYFYPAAATGVGWFLTALALLQIPFWAIHVVCKQHRGATWFQRFKNSLNPSEEWGPKNPSDRFIWKEQCRTDGPSSQHLWIPKMPFQVGSVWGRQRQWQLNTD